MFPFGIFMLRPSRTQQTWSYFLWILIARMKLFASIRVDFTSAFIWMLNSFSIYDICLKLKFCCSIEKKNNPLLFSNVSNAVSIASRIFYITFFLSVVCLLSNFLSTLMFREFLSPLVHRTWLIFVCVWKQMSI